MLLLVAFGFGLGMSVIPSLASSSNVSLQVAQPSAQLVTDTERLFANVYNTVSPSVVAIDISQRSPGGGFVPEASGSGFVIDQQGHIVTNNHVVDGADRIEVNFYDGTIVQADVVGVDPDSDLAVIKVDLPADRLHPVTFADSNQLVIGQQTLAIGSPFGERWTLTSGIISALNRTIQGLAGYQIGAVIQTDAAINPGNSGGPLLNMQGQVIGVNSQIYSQTRSNSGVGFAVPSNLVRRVVTALISKGRVDYSYLGISSHSGDVDLDLINEYHLPNNIRGVVIESIQPNSPAQQAGLKDRSNNSVDIITSVNDVPITGFDTLIAYLASNTDPGQTVNLSVYRDGKTLSVPLTLGSRPSQ
jgi:2-alkenal reductase